MFEEWGGDGGHGCVVGAVEKWRYLYRGVQGRIQIAEKWDVHDFM